MVTIALPVASLKSMPIYVAQERGLFKKRGVDVDVITSRGGGEAMKAYIAGEVQIIATGFPEVGLLRKRGVDVELFFAQTTRVPFALISRKDLNVKSVVDLKGKTIAVTSPGSLTANLARYFVKDAGLDPDRDVSLVSVGGGGEILGALKVGRADAAMVFEPRHHRSAARLGDNYHRRRRPAQRVLFLAASDKQGFPRKVAGRRQSGL